MGCTQHACLESPKLAKSVKLKSCCLAFWRLFVLHPGQRPATLRPKSCNSKAKVINSREAGSRVWSLDCQQQSMPLLGRKADISEANAPHASHGRWFSSPGRTFRVKVCKSKKPKQRRESFPGRRTLRGRRSLSGEALRPRRSLRRGPTCRVIGKLGEGSGLRAALRLGGRPGQRRVGGCLGVVRGDRWKSCRAGGFSAPPCPKSLLGPWVASENSSRAGARCSRAVRRSGLVAC